MPSTIPSVHKPRLLDQVRQALRTRHYSPATERCYISWIRRFILFQGKRHPETMGAEEIAAYLTHLATRRQVSASTQNQALSALLFLYREVLECDFCQLDGLVRAKRPRRLPVVLTREELRTLLAELHGVHWLMASLLYGSGLRLLECARLRVQDVEFNRKEITVRDGKGQKDRRTMLPGRLVVPLREHLESVGNQHRRDVATGAGSVALPHALARKYPRAPFEWRWQ